MRCNQKLVSAIALATPSLRCVRAMTTSSGVPADSAADAPVETRSPRRRKARVASVVLAIVLLACAAAALQQPVPPTAEPSVSPEAMLLVTTAFYTSLLALRWISPDAAWWVGIIQGIAAFVIACVLAWITAPAAPTIAAGYLIFLAGRAFWARVDRARGYE